jgi:hypothetical protein
MNVLLEPMSVPKRYNAVPEHTGTREHFLKRGGKKIKAFHGVPHRTSVRSHKLRATVKVKRSRNWCLTQIVSRRIL